jgi:hypothetical protein
VADSSRRALLWCQEHLGLEFHAATPVIKAASARNSDHEEKQAELLPFRVLLLLEMLVKENSSPFTVWIAITWLLLAYAVLRFQHLQRSSVQETTEDSIHARCSLGKSRRGGRRRPFYWICPARSLTGLDISGTLLNILQRARGPDPPNWLLYDFGPPRTPLDAVTELLPKPMTLARFMYFSKQIFSSPSFGLDEDQLKRITSYSARRILPTVAERRGFTPIERLSVGGWKGAEALELRKQMSIPDRYADHRLQTALELKRDCLTGLQLGLRKAGPPSMKWDWKQAIDSMAPRSEARLSATTSTLQASSSSTCTLDRLGDVPEAPRGQQCSDDSSGASTANPEDPSESDESSESADSSQPCGPEEVEWLLATSRGGRLHLLGSALDDTRARCGRRLRQPRDGVGLESAASDSARAEWSPRCWGKLHKSQRKAWKQLRKQ